MKVEDLKKIIPWIKRHWKTLYCYVPPCPMCGSPVTGYYIKLHRDAVSEWQIDDSLKHGELIKPVQEVPKANCFCMNCDYEWIGDVTTRLLSLEEIEEEKQKRLTKEILNQRVALSREERRNDHGAFKTIRRYIGKL